MVNFDELMKQLQAVSIFPGITPVDILALPDPVDSAVQKILRRGPMGVAEMAAVLNLPEDEAKQIADILVEKGYLLMEERHNDGSVVYKVYFARMRGRNIPLDL